MIIEANHLAVQHEKNAVCLESGCCVTKTHNACLLTLPVSAEDHLTGLRFSDPTGFYTSNNFLNETSDRATSSKLKLARKFTVRWPL